MTMRVDINFWEIILPQDTNVPEKKELLISNHNSLFNRYFVIAVSV